MPCVATWPWRSTIAWSGLGSGLGLGLGNPSVTLTQTLTRYDGVRAMWEGGRGGFRTRGGRARQTAPTLTRTRTRTRTLPEP
eukprot:scaffold36478_cov60-Phaeocystis_antarctica.AAC.5